MLNIVIGDVIYFIASLQSALQYSHFSSKFCST